jgi:3-oxoacyl-[acyl-carrier-protein] synthase-1
MKPVYIAADNIYSPLGISSQENFEKVKRGESAIRAITNPSLSAETFYASLFDRSFFSKEENDLTRFEKICVASIQDALSTTEIKLSDADTLFILSTTKGNIELIETNAMNEELRKRVSLFTAAKNIGASFGAVNKPVVVSNACISGVLSVIIAKRLLQSGKYKHAVITGADVLSRFIISGFQSLHAMSAKPCKPFDKQRDGINLGECASTIILTTEKALSKGVVVGGGASSNDANHISGPSRTGLELSFAVQSAMKDSDVSAKDLSFISAHGTATTYNDEMEAKAFTHAGLNDIALHSLKGHFGHTLGAAGVLESILTYRSLKEGIVLPSKNFEELGVSEKVNVNKNLSKSNKTHALKNASGFGGCNAAVIYSIQ